MSAQNFGSTPRLPDLDMRASLAVGAQASRGAVREPKHEALLRAIDQLRASVRGLESFAEEVKTGDQRGIPGGQIVQAEVIPSLAVTLESSPHDLLDLVGKINEITAELRSTLF